MEMGSDGARSPASSTHTTLQHAQGPRSPGSGTGHVLPNPPLPSAGDAGSFTQRKSLDVKDLEVWTELHHMAPVGFDMGEYDDDHGPSSPPIDPVVEQQTGESPGPEEKPRHSHAFHRWLRTLQRRAVRRRKTLDDHDGRPVSLNSHHGNEGIIHFPPSWHRRKSSSASSFNFLTAVRSTGTSLASVSVLTRSKRNGILSPHGHSRTDRSSRASASGVRLSEDSAYLEGSMTMDPATTERSLQRRRILEELISTEEGYIGDLRFLMNVYVTILASLPALPASLRSSIKKTLSGIVELHEEILGDLHRVVPDSEYTQIDVPLPVLERRSRSHQRWRSLDAVPEDKADMTWLQSLPGMTADPQVVAEVAKIFSKKMYRFFVYEEYSARYEIMVKNIASTHRSLPLWESYQKGLEVLASSLASSAKHTGNSKKSLTIADLLVKPIQRVCRYPLLFAELIKYTPVCDCPNAHMEIEDVLSRLREATSEINRAIDHSGVKVTLEKTWILRDRLAFPSQRLDATSRSRIRALGHIQLCGVLHVCWQTKEGVSGQYMICLLYRDWLCFATASRCEQIYTIQACIALKTVRLEEADNGRGLQCHTAFTWKLVFECDHQLYEVIMSACSRKEESEWRRRLQTARAGNDQARDDFNLFSSLSLDIKTLGAVFRKPGTMVRRLSIHRATTVGPKSPLCQVILKDTAAVGEGQRSSPYDSSINRSQSLLTAKSRLPILAPARGDRARLEALLSDVWTRDALPFLGVASRTRSEHNVRNSASSVIRKISVASIASSFTKRSASLASLHRTACEDSMGDRPEELRAADIDSDKTRFPELRGETKGPGTSRLAMIYDENEQQSSPTIDRGVEAHRKLTPVMHAIPAQRPVQGKLATGDYPVEDSRVQSTKSQSPALRSSSANSVRITPTPSPLTKVPVGPEKENVQQEPAPGGCESSSRNDPAGNNTSRWSRVGGGRHRATVAQSLRSFFR